MATKPVGIILHHIRKIVIAHDVEQLSDRELLRRFAQERDETAFATLVRRHGPMILRACQRVLHNWHDAEDAFQATFLILARKAASRKWHESVGTWLYLVAYRLALKIRAGRDRHSQHNTRSVERSSEDPQAAASARELRGVLDEELSRLPEKCRAPMVLCSLEGFTRDQAARHLGWSLGTLRRRLKQGRALLRQRLVRRGLPLTAIFAAVLGIEEAAQATVPLVLTRSVVQMAMTAALGKVVPAALVSSRAAALAEGMLKGMWIITLKGALAAVLVLAVAGVGAGLALRRAALSESADQKPPESLRSAAQESARPPGSVQPRVAPGTGQLTITGIILMPNGSPAVSALVSSLGGDEGSARTVRTDSQGRFGITGEFGNDCRLHAHSADMSHQTTFRVPEVLARKRSVRPVEMKLTPAREHVVTVTAENTPVEGAQVAATGTNYKVRGVTDKYGKVKLRVPSEEPLTALVAWHPRLGAAGFRNLDHGITTASSKLAILATRPHTIRVTGADGRAVPSLRLGVSFRTDMPNWIETGEIGGAHVCTDADGNVTSPWFPRQFKGIGVHIIDSDASDWKIDEIDRAKSADGLTTVRVRRKIPVQGQLVMPRGMSGEGLLITGGGFGPTNHGDYATARANRDGSFTLRVASNHGYALGILDSDWASDAWTGMILPNDKSEPAHITLNVYPAIPLTIRVTHGPQHQPVANAGISLNNQTEFTYRGGDGTKRSGIGGASTWLQTNSNGVASAGLGKGKYSLRLSVGEWHEERTLQVTTDKPVSVDFDKPWLEKRKIAGRLFRDNTPHKPSKTTTIRAWSTEEDGERPRPVPSQVSSEPLVSSDGRFEIAIDARALSVLAVDPEQRLSGFARLGQTDSDFNLALAPTAIYSGVLVDGKGRLLAGKTLRLIVAGSDIVADQNELRDPQGRFQFDRVPTKVPLELQVREQGDGRKDFAPLGKRFFLPDERRENTTVVLASNDSSGASSDASKVSPDLLEERLESLTRDARLSAMRVLVVLQGDASKNVADTVHQLLDFEEHRQVLGYLPLVISPERIQSSAATVARLGWQRPQAGEIVLIAIDGDGRRVGSQRLAISSVDAAVQFAKAFVKQHAPPARDARALLAEAQSDAKKTGRHVWIVFCGPRCGPCFRLARWMEDQHALLAKAYVVLKIREGLDKGAWEASKELKQPANAGIPWIAITEPDGTVLVTSDGPLGNIGFPTAFEDVRHLRDMLSRTAQQLNAEDRERIVRSLSKLEE